MSTLCHVCLFYHFEANGTEKARNSRFNCKSYKTMQALDISCTHQTKSLLLSSYEFKRPLHKGAWWRDFFLLPEEAEGLLREAKPPRDDGTAAKLGTDKPPSPAAAKVRVGTTFPELLPLLVTALLPAPPLVFPVFPVLLLVLGTELAPPALSCGRLLDIMRGRRETPQNPLRCCSKHPDSAAICAALAGWLTSWLACVLASWDKATVPGHPADLNKSLGVCFTLSHWQRVRKSLKYKRQSGMSAETDKNNLNCVIREISSLATVSYGQESLEFPRLPRCPARASAPTTALWRGGVWLPTLQDVIEIK